MLTVFEVVPNGSCWEIRPMGAPPLAELKLQQVAVDIACDLAKRESPSRVILRASDGRAQREWTFGEARLLAS